MKTWGYAIGYDQETIGLIIVTKRPWYVAAISGFNDVVCSRISNLLERVEFPAWPKCFKNEYDERCSPRDYYGTLGCWLYTKIVSPLDIWCYNKGENIELRVPYEKLKEKFYEGNKDFFDDWEEPFAQEPEKKEIKEEK